MRHRQLRLNSHHPLRKYPRLGPLQRSQRHLLCKWVAIRVHPNISQVAALNVMRSNGMALNFFYDKRAFFRDSLMMFCLTICNATFSATPNLTNSSNIIQRGPNSCASDHMTGGNMNCNVTIKKEAPSPDIPVATIDIGDELPWKLNNGNFISRVSLYNPSKATIPLFVDVVEQITRPEKISNSEMGDIVNKINNLLDKDIADGMPSSGDSQIGPNKILYKSPAGGQLTPQQIDLINEGKLILYHFAAVRYEDNSDRPVFLYEAERCTYFNIDFGKFLDCRAYNYSKKKVEKIPTAWSVRSH
jgi:hypothetical protein